MHDQILSVADLTLAQVRRAIRAMHPGFHVLTSAEWDRIPWTAHPRKRPPAARHDTIQGRPIEYGPRGGLRAGALWPQVTLLFLRALA